MRVLASSAYFCVFVRAGKVKFVYKYYGVDDACKPVTGPSHAVLAGNFLRWATPGSGKKPTCFYPCEMSRLQCFPESYHIHQVNSIAGKCIGNAIPPVIMYQILRGNKPPKEALNPATDRPCKRRRKLVADTGSPTRHWDPPPDSRAFGGCGGSWHRQEGGGTSGTAFG